MSTRSELRERIASVRSDVERAGFDAALISSLTDIRYLTGFTGSNALLVLTKQRATLLTDPRYTFQAGAESAGSGALVKIPKGPLEAAAVKLLEKARAVGFQPEHIRWTVWNHLRGALGRRKFEALPGLVENRRMIKSPSEIDAVRASVLLNSQAFAAALTRFRPGMSERDLAAEIEYQMRLLGAEKPAFETIVAFGPNSAMPHARPGDRKLERNGLLLIDMGTFRGGYASDMTRCVHLGKPGSATRNLYRAVWEAQQAAIDAVAPGVRAGQVDAAARNVLKSHGLDKAFLHSTGHGLGLEIHESPRIGRKQTTPLEAGMTVTIEPGAYLEGVGGVRIEDTVLVTPTGVEILTPTSKDLVTL